MRIYEDPQATSKNRLAPRDYYIPIGRSEYKPLNGQWSFAYFERDIDVPEKIEKWDTAYVPSCWQSLGYGEPNYTNQCYPYPCDPPYVPDDNPCGVYEREFTIDKLWGRVYFVFEGVCSCAFLYINGREVGFTQGSHLQAEFDITDYVKRGVNTVRVKVLKWCCGSYLEDQDMFRFNGIFRDCYILIRPPEHIRNICVKTENNRVLVFADRAADITLYDAEGKLIGIAKNTKNAELEVEKPVFWNAEKPYLYKVRAERDGEIISINTAFRTIEIDSEYALRINGVRVKLHGVNHHDTHPSNGWCMTNSELRRDLELMKKLNINCIRTSHYPPAPAFLEMCDELGFYVVLETDIETHGIVQRRVGVGYDSDNPVWPCSNPDWKKEFIERMQRTVLRDRNHPSIIMWSLGNESGFGDNHKAMSDWVRQQRDGRLIHCEDASRKSVDYNHPELTAYTDVFSWMYPLHSAVKAYAEDKEKKQPYFMCEYAHSMGNSPGSVWEYSELVDKFPKLIGGCIWEWADHTVIVDGVQKYGGDFKGELTHDGNFCCDGMVFSDRSFRAGSLEIKAAYQPMKTVYKNGLLTVFNRYDFTDLSECEFSYYVKCDGVKVKSESLRLKVPPHGNTSLKITVPEKKCMYGMTLDCALIKNGERAAHTQHILPVKPLQAKPCKKTGRVTQSGGNIIFSGNGYRYTFSRHYGMFTSLISGGAERICGIPRLSVWRAPIDNDRLFLHTWRETERFDRVLTKIYGCEYNNGGITVNGSLSGISRAPFCRFILKITVDGNGKIDFNVTADINKETAWLPRFGFEWELPPTADAFSYYGSGPYESYCDSDHASSVGFYSSTADGEYVNYVRPQEHGNHNKTKMVAIGGLVFTAFDLMEFNVSRYSTEALTAAAHTNELKKDGKVHLRTDYRVSGLGSASCGPEPLEEYKLSEKQIGFGFSVMPE